MDKQQLKAAAAKTVRLTEAAGVAGMLDLAINAGALTGGEAHIMVLSNIQEMTPEQAKCVGYALYKLGCLGIELETSNLDEIDDTYFEG
jgi:hypothetical protein